MIICHPKKLIFIKTKKVGGTSFEIALSKFCGDDCVITPITPEDEQLRVEMGFRGAQNYRNTVWAAHGMQTRGELFNHIPAPTLRSVMPREIWDGYTKIAFYRNPFDAVISRYYWHGGEETGMAFDEFVTRHPEVLTENTLIAPFSGEAKLDHYLRYESIGDELDGLGLGDVREVFSTLRTKGNLRPRQGASVQDVYRKFPQVIDFIAEACAEEIAHFGYDRPQA